MPVHLARALTREQAYSSYKFSAASEPITFPYAPAKRRVKIHKEAMAGSLEQLNLHLPVRHSRFARPRRRGDMELDLRVRVEASLTSRPPKTGVFGSISSFLPMTDVFAGAAARAASQSTIHPLDTIKVRMQATLKDKRSLRGKKCDKRNRSCQHREVRHRHRPSYAQCAIIASFCGNRNWRSFGKTWS